MRMNRNHWQALNDKDIFEVNFHKFMELESKSNQIEIAEEFGITLGEVNMLKRKINRT
ncbi:hypothetical protein ACLIBG_04255 [Virgibacillus sp. W0181]|uniref:hypothetical protein n=1 Tax=Virgibacillus sp. W0181 TaxID=3391581 RepID=UPI003F4493DD